MVCMLCKHVISDSSCNLTVSLSILLLHTNTVHTVFLFFVLPVSDSWSLFLMMIWPPFSLTQVKEFYRSCVNIQEIDRLGAEPMMEVIDSCGGWDLAGAPPGGAGWESGSVQTRPDFNEMLYRTQGVYSTAVFFSLTVNVDDKNSSRNAIRVSD